MCKLKASKHNAINKRNAIKPTKMTIQKIDISVFHLSCKNMNPKLTLPSPTARHIRRKSWSFKKQKDVTLAQQQRLYGLGLFVRIEHLLLATNKRQ